MKISRLLLLIYLAPGLAVSAQTLLPEEILATRGEIYFKTVVGDRDLVNKISHLVSVDYLHEDTVFAYANEKEFLAFTKTGLDYTILLAPGLRDVPVVMRDNVDIRNIRSWDFYPTYTAYLDMMQQYADEYPDLCQCFSIGQTVNGRELMMLRISDNVATREAEPQFLYTGTMHGDELAGYVLLLRLADHLLSGYGQDAAITDLIDNTEIWINPLANPDGTFYGGNHTVNGSRRYNANSVDLNRNYPDPEDGPHPDGKAWQPETIAFMQLAEAQNFVMSANTHGGAEVINYPWDTWSQPAADATWWRHVARQYVDTVHLYSPASYLDDFDNGITNGYQWYSISGGRQDYMNYFHHCREVTMELSNVKKLATSALESHWQWNYRSLLNYYGQCRYGVAGTVADASTGQPLKAKVFIEGHDIDQSWVFADSLAGFYQRLLAPGSYSLTFSAQGYLPLTIPAVQVSYNLTTALDVTLSPAGLMADFSASQNAIATGSSISFTDLSSGDPVMWQWAFEGGVPATSSLQNPTNIFYNSPGTYNVSLTITDAGGHVATSLKTNFINVDTPVLMANQTLTLSGGLFYDSGGENNNYDNNQNLTTTFLPKTPQAKVSVEFLEFSLESQASCSYDYLKIYDGTSAAAPLLGTWCGTQSPGKVVATNAAGALTFAFHSDYSVTKSGWKALVRNEAMQQMTLPAGWSGLSLYVNPEENDAAAIFEEVIDDVIILVGEAGEVLPANNPQQALPWNSRKGYFIKMSEPATLAIPGTVVINKTINLHAGWNLLPIIIAEPLLPGQLVTQPAGAIKAIKEAAGTGVWWPEKVIATLPALVPGKSYWVFVSQETMLVFP
ncbi:MAG: M14 family zinc carboxypeptidase [Bacteroidales bacterium]|nr:M14 family zinc carboxypeptidase [Bacteroidales bacterium]NCU34550.1 PKD domain-containing protein [Candidatus Falkowbacteria bacterium]MDD3527003.1 M14 family zinc carboxypeptidase [Bacteroidales bacterium]MDD4176235.1 M14 family zinc carboxypeptidase [Bacteroidales bacterium]MDD4740461.1 M14 family zinc carboxypeptidase [Bacteroidales bacterium]